MRLPPLQPVVNVANARLSRSSLDAEHTCDIFYVRKASMIPSCNVPLHVFLI